MEDVGEVQETSLIEIEQVTVEAIQRFKFSKHHSTRHLLSRDFRSQRNRYISNLNQTNNSEDGKDRKVEDDKLNSK